MFFLFYLKSHGTLLRHTWSRGALTLLETDLMNKDLSHVRHTRALKLSQWQTNVLWSLQCAQRMRVHNLRLTINHMESILMNVGDHVKHCCCSIYPELLSLWVRVNGCRVFKPEENLLKYSRTSGVVRTFKMAQPPMDASPRQYKYIQIFGQVTKSVEANWLYFYSSSCKYMNCLSGCNKKLKITGVKNEVSYT